MQIVRLDPIPDFETWRGIARDCLQAGHPPEKVIWQTTDDTPHLALFPETFFTPDPNATPMALKVPREFVELAKAALCHRSPERFALLYRLLWRLTHENKNLLHYQTDDDILQLNRLVKNVRRDAYKTKAFLRFREVQDADGEAHFVAWHEPEHYSLELTLPFFETRFRNMRWTILTPYRAAHWDGETMRLSDNPNPELHPDFDQVEQYWLTYYASTFNPGRTNRKAMLTQMPQKYWKTMPEAALIRELLNDAGRRVADMVDRENQQRG